MRKILPLLTTIACGLLGFGVLALYEILSPLWVAVLAYVFVCLVALVFWISGFVKKTIKGIAE